MDSPTEIIQATPILPVSDAPPVPVDSTESMRAALVQAVQPELKEILAAQVELAKGMWVKDFIKDRKTGQYKIDPETGRPVTKIYFKVPDKDAGQYLLNQVIGKPKENTVVEGKVTFLLDL